MRRAVARADVRGIGAWLGSVKDWIDAGCAAYTLQCGNDAGARGPTRCAAEVAPPQSARPPCSAGSWSGCADDKAAVM